MKVYNNLRESECHFAFLFASPLVIFKEMMGGQPVLQPILWDIDFMKDLKHIKTILRSVKSDVKFISSMASVSSLSSILKKKPMILHFCGHGVSLKKDLNRIKPFFRIFSPSQPISIYHRGYRSNKIWRI